jgi:hypothetical protein
MAFATVAAILVAAAASVERLCTYFKLIFWFEDESRKVVFVILN